MKTDMFDPRWLNCEIYAGKQVWNAVYLDYQIAVLRDLIAGDESHGDDPEGHPLAGIVTHLEDVLGKCGYKSEGGSR